MKTTQQRIDEIIKTIDRYVGKMDVLTEQLLIGEMEALVIQAQLEQLKK